MLLTFHNIFVESCVFNNVATKTKLQILDSKRLTDPCRGLNYFESFSSPLSVDKDVYPIILNWGNPSAFGKNKKY